MWSQKYATKILRNVYQVRNKEGARIITDSSTCQTCEDVPLIRMVAIAGEV